MNAFPSVPANCREAALKGEIMFAASAAGGIALALLTITVIYLFGATSLWLPMSGGGEYMNPRYIPWIMYSIPCGTLVGCVLTLVLFFKHTCSIKMAPLVLANICLGLIAGFIAIYQVVFLLGFFHTLLVVGMGLSMTILGIWGAWRKFHTGRGLI